MLDDNGLRLRAFWDARAEREKDREEMDSRKQVHTDLLMREIRRCIGNRSGLQILDAGGGTGRFSVPLASEGHFVTHLDISPNMLKAAEKVCCIEGVDGIEFLEGTVEDLSMFDDNSFDLVLCLDSPVSFCGDYKSAIRELVRVANSQLILCVMNRLGVVAGEGIGFDLKHYGRPQTVIDVMEKGSVEFTDEILRIDPGIMQGWHAFEPNELKSLLNENGCTVESMSAPGALSRFIQPEAVSQLLKDNDAYQTFLDFEEKYDANPYVLGVGAVGAGGLMVSAQKDITAQG